jgi:hypothetical protein
VAAPGQGLYVCLIGAAIVCGSSATFLGRNKHAASLRTAELHCLPGSAPGLIVQDGISKADCEENVSRV